MYKKIMVALDGSELAECALPHLETVLKGSKSAEVIVVQAVEPIAIPFGLEAAKITSLEKFNEFATHQKTDAEKYLNGIVARLEKTGANIKAEIIFGKAAESLSDYANKNDIDLVIIATHGRSGVSRWVWGSVAARLIRSVRAPVLVVRAPEAVIDP